MVKQEQSGFRLLAFNDFRRDSELNMQKLYATDIDWLEFKFVGNLPEPIALIDMKSGHSWSRIRYGKYQVSVVAQFILAKRANLPFYVVEHTDDYSTWKIKKVTSEKTHIDVRSTNLAGYIRWLYEIRSEKVPDTVNFILQKHTTIDMSEKIQSQLIALFERLPDGSQTAILLQMAKVVKFDVFAQFMSDWWLYAKELYDSKNKAA